MECGIFTILGVMVGALVMKFANVKTGGFFARVLKRGGSGNVGADDGEKEKLSMSEQWENLLNYDGNNNGK